MVDRLPAASVEAVLGVEQSNDQLGQIRIRINEMADRAAQHKDVLLGELLKNGASAGFNSYDGVSFFNSAHASGKSGDQSNVVTEAGTVDKDNPTTAEWRVALRNGLARLLTFKDDQGEIMSFGATGLVAVVPPNMFVTAAESLNATLVSSTTNVLQGAARIIVFPYLTVNDTFYLLKTDVAVRPFIFQDRIPLEFTALEGASDEGFRRDKFLYGVRARYRMTLGYWQYALKVTFTA
ncbi:MAG: Mu-like prophage major head subunit gpT family protein [Planctomycetes bacterium]|nr:Mu-like prophage major head subunit gpT family protein [Planctomycetota bacterium]